MKKCFIVLGFAFITTIYLSADTFYVDGNDPNANNSNPGTINLPWLTIQHAADQLMPGDTVLIRNAVYHENVITTRNGNSNQGYIVFSAYPGENFTLDGTGVGDHTGLRIYHSYITIDGWEISNWTENGIWISEAHNIFINNCNVHDVFYGIGISDSTHDFELNNVEMYNFDLYGFDASPGSGSCYNGILNNCIARNARDPQQNVDGFALGHGDQHNFIFNHCTTYDVFDGFDISSRKTTLNSCRAFNCWNGGYKLWEDSVVLINCIGYNCTGSNVELDWNGNPTRTEIINCTFYGAQTYTIWIENQNDTLYLFNSILSGGDNIGLAFEQYSTDNYFGNYNLFHNYNQSRAIAVAYTDEFSLSDVQNGIWTSYSNQDSNSIVEYNPANIFVDYNSADFHLCTQSPAIDQASAQYAPNYDFDGNPRPYGSGYDIGAYEYQGVGAEENNTIHFNHHRVTSIINNNHSIQIIFTIDHKQDVNLSIYNLAGQKIDQIISSPLIPGTYYYHWDANKYDICRNQLFYAILTAGEQTYVAKFIVME